MADKLVLGVGLACDLQAAFRRHGYSEEDVKGLSEGDFLAHVLAVRQGRARITPVVRTNVVDLDAAPYMPQGWSVHEEDQLPNRMRGTIDLATAKLDLHRSKAQKKGTVRGVKLKKQYAESENLFLGANALDFYLKPENQHLIPEEWKQVNAVFFWGTIYRDGGGGLCVRCLYWRGGRWIWVCHWLDGGWDSDDPAAASASSA